MSERKDMCECGENEATDPHECPYQAELYGCEYQEYCRCCAKCQQNCADEI